MYNPAMKKTSNYSNKNANKNMTAILINCIRLIHYVTFAESSKHPSVTYRVFYQNENVIES